MATRRFGTVETLPSGKFRARYRHPETRALVTVGTYPTKTAARQALSRIEVELADQGPVAIDPTAGRVTFGAVADRWYEEMSPGWRKRTRQSYSVALRLHIKPHLGRRRIGTITPADITAWQAKISTSPASAVVARNVAGQVFAWAVDGRIIGRNPLAGRRMRRRSDTKLTIPTAVEVGKIADAVPEQYRALIWTAAIAALRWGEVAGLSRQDIDVPGRRIHVRQQVTVADQDAGLVLGPLKTEGSAAAVSIPVELAVMLEDHLARFVDEAGDALLFPSKAGTPLWRQNWQRIWDKAIEDAKVPRCTPHGLRHFGGTSALEAGATLKQVQARMRHQTPTTTLRYLHVLSERDEEIADRLGSHLR